MTSTRRRPDRAEVATLMVALVALAVAGLLLRSRARAPSDMAFVPLENLSDSNGVVVKNPMATGLHDGDRVVAVEGRPMGLWMDHLLDPNVRRPRFVVGRTLVYRVERGGRLRDVPVTLQPYPLALHVRHHLSLVALIVLQLSIGTFVFVRRPHLRAARAALILTSFAACAANGWMFPLEVGDLVGATGFWRFMVGETFDALQLAALLHFSLVFPRPRPVLERRPSLLGLVYGPLVLSAIWLAVILPIKSGRFEGLHLGFLPLVLTEVIYPFVVLGALIHAYRSMKDPVSHRQLRLWVLTFGVGLILYMALWLIPASIRRQPLLPWEWEFFVFLPAPIAMAIAILRYQAFEIKVFLNRTLVYGGLTICLFGIYALTVQQMGRLLTRGTGPVVATALVAVLFAPLRERLQRTANRLLYGERGEPYKVVSRLGRRLETALEPGEVLPVIVETITQALRLPYAAIELKRGDGFELATARGDLVTEPLRLPLTCRGERVGQLVLAPRGPTETFTRTDYRLLEDLARQAGVAVQGVLVTEDLQRSRQRLVSTREEERRRLQRDLHDGLGSTLAGVALGLQAIGNAVETDRATALRLLQRMQAEVQTAIGDVRRLVYDLRPPGLAQLGLVGAMRAQTAMLASEVGGHGLQVTVEAEAEGELSSLPAAVEVAAYRIALEAVTNAVRHARARTCGVRLTVNGSLRLEIRDDGAGLPADYRAGVGLASMRERAAELGGSFSIERLSAGGTLVCAQLPLPRHRE